ncbi:hypothetical protein ACEWY4_022350 [Coilia grayii]|uniref:Rho-GAP domain-containing protein n=1 Tax=Coilia grayii TaxID=363190 RepID=A0ABD1J5R7_9TELE
MRRGSYDDAAVSIRPHLRSLAQRRRSAPSLAFGRALGIPWNAIREEEAWVAMEQCPFVLGLSSDGSPLLLDECVQLTEGQKTRERHLFLFGRELVIAKLKSSASYRLKHRLSLEELWLYPCDDEKEEEEEEEEEEPMDFQLKTSLVLVWPMAFCVVTFGSPEVKTRWVESLHSKIIEAQERSLSSSPPLGILMKVLSGNIMTKTLTGGGTEGDMDVPPEGNGKGSASQSQLCNKEEAGKQPIGHSSSQSSKLSLLAKKLRRSSTHSGSSSSRRLLFGQPLSKICLEDGSLPKPITEILRLLWKNGPTTEGIFRKAWNSSKLNVLREQLNTGHEVDLESQHVLLLVGLLKTFLKDLPGSLLMDEKYDDWLSAMDKEDEHDRLTEIRSVIETIPEPHVLLLQHLLCVLHHISQSADLNKMGASNLAVCIAPSLFHQMESPMRNGLVQTEELKRVTQKVTGLTQFLIEKCTSVFGEDLLTLFGDPEEEELADNSDSMSSHQHDSAYDSTDPDADVDAGVASECDSRPAMANGVAARRKEHSIVASCSSDAIFSAFTNPLNRRCSEPAIFPWVACSHASQGLARSHDDCSAHTEDFQELKKQTSDDSFLLLRQAERRLAQPELRKLGGSLTMDLPLCPSTGRASTASKDYSSSCSLESAASNISESSVFTSSPLGSPTSNRRSHSAKQQAASSSSRSQSVSSKLPSKSEQQPKAEGEVKRRSQSMRTKGLGGLFNRASMKRGEAQKEVVFPCGPLQEDSQSEVETPTEAGDLVGQPVRRQRPLSAIEVFQHVDSRLPGSPPSYEQALRNSSQVPPPQYGAMTVYAAREQRSRPVSMNEGFLLNSSCHIGHFTDSFPSRLEPGKSSASQAAVPFRARAMSESVSRPQDTVARRCSQPLFEELSYAKESYV